MTDHDPDSITVDERDGKLYEVPAPSNLEEEQILNEVWDKGWQTHKLTLHSQNRVDELEFRQKAIDEALSQLKQLILKDVLDLIGPDVEVLTDVIPSESYYLGKNAEKKSLRQSAGKRYQS